MSKGVRRDRHRRRRARTSPAGRIMQRRVNRDVTVAGHGRPGRLLDRILAMPQIAQAVPRLPPDLLHRVIQQCGLEDCGGLVALATPGQLASLFDLDLWRPAAPGLDDRFDAARFGTWLEVMVEADLANAAATLAAMDVDLVIAGFVQHVRVFDHAAVADYITLDGEVSPGRAFDDSLCREVAGYLVSAKRTEYWDAMTSVLVALADAHGDCFSRLMRGCCGLSNSRPEADVDELPTSAEQAMFDLAVGREGRRDTQGYVTPAQARAFLQMSRRIDIRHGALPPRDPMTRAYLRGIEASTMTGRVHEWLPGRRKLVEPAPDGADGAVAKIVELLNEAGVMSRAPRGLLEGARTSAPRLARIRAHLQFVQDHEPGAYAMRNAELAYLANVIAAGSMIQSRPVVTEEASTAAVAVCNLGLERWPAHWLADEVGRMPESDLRRELPDDFLIRHDLVSVFQVGWTVLHDDVCMYAADRLISVLALVHSADSEVQAGIEILRATLMRHTRAGSPWDSRDALHVIAILDAPSWAALRGLIDEFPTLHAAVRASLNKTAHRIDASAFEFISETSQVQEVHRFLQRLPGILDA